MQRSSSLLELYLIAVVVAIFVLFTQFALVSGVEVTVTVQGTDVVFNGETLRAPDNGSSLSYTFDTKHLNKHVKPWDDTNITVNYGDEDIIYAGTNISEVLSPEKSPASDILYVVKFTDGPIVVIFDIDHAGRYSMGGIDMPPWGSDYYDTAIKLYKEYLKGL